MKTLKITVKYSVDDSLWCSVWTHVLDCVNISVEDSVRSSVWNAMETVGNGDSEWSAVQFKTQELSK